MKNYFANLKENSKKGFSLVELIIVIAIMAILVGVVAATVIPYMEKSRKAKDQQQLSSITTSAVSAISELNESAVGFNITYTTALSGLTGFSELVNNETAEGLYDKFKSKAFQADAGAKGVDVSIAYGGVNGSKKDYTGTDAKEAQTAAPYGLQEGQVVTYLAGAKGTNGNKIGTGDKVTSVFTKDKNEEAISE